MTQECDQHIEFMMTVIINGCSKVKWSSQFYLQSPKYQNPQFTLSSYAVFSMTPSVFRMLIQIRKRQRVRISFPPKPLETMEWTSAGATDPTGKKCESFTINC